MSRSTTPPASETPHLVSLVLHSKKALQHGEQLCTRAHELTHSTATLATDILALDAKSSWAVQGIIEQLKLAGNVANSIEIQRVRLEDQAKEWDKTRSIHSGNLDSILESLERQVVPPNFHLSSSSSSLFGSQGSDNAEESRLGGSKKIHNGKMHNGEVDRSKWKTLRDFVDFGSIVKATEEMDEDRDMLDDILARTESFPFNLNDSIASLRDGIPTADAVPPIKDLFNSQEIITANMANHLESLGSHYDEMAAALRDKEAGVELSDEDLLDMNRDTDELPSIIAELEDDVAKIKYTHDQLLEAKDAVLSRMSILSETVSQLDELECVMSEMLEQQQIVETEHEFHLASLQQHLTTLEHLCITFTSYETSFNALLLELERRRRYRDGAEEIVRGLARQLDAMRDEEIQLRDSFFAEHGPHLPDDLCLCVANMPTKWVVGPATDETSEELPVIDEDLLIEATKRMDLVKDGTESL